MSAQLCPKTRTTGNKEVAPRGGPGAHRAQLRVGGVCGTPSAGRAPLGSGDTLVAERQAPCKASWAGRSNEASVWRAGSGDSFHREQHRWVRPELAILWDPKGKAGRGATCRQKQNSPKGPAGPCATCKPLGTTHRKPSLSPPGPRSPANAAAGGRPGDGTGSWGQALGRCPLPLLHSTAF